MGNWFFYAYFYFIVELAAILKNAAYTTKEEKS